MRQCLRKLWVCCFAALLMLPGAAIACSTDKMKTTDDGSLFKVVGGSNKVEAEEAPGSKSRAFTLDLLLPYYVISEEEEFYKITDLAADTVTQAETGRVGYVPREQVYPWRGRERLNFANSPGQGSELFVWDDEDSLRRFLETGEQKFGLPAFWMIERERTKRPYPVLSSKLLLMRNGQEKRVFKVLLPVELPATENKFDKFTHATFRNRIRLYGRDAPFRQRPCRRHQSDVRAPSARCCETLGSRFRVLSRRIRRRKVRYSRDVSDCRGHESADKGSNRAVHDRRGGPDQARARCRLHRASFLFVA